MAVSTLSDLRVLQHVSFFYLKAGQNPCSGTHRIGTIDSIDTTKKLFTILVDGPTFGGEDQPYGLKRKILFDFASIASYNIDVESRPTPSYGDLTVDHFDDLQCEDNYPEPDISEAEEWADLPYGYDDDPHSYECFEDEWDF